MLRVGYGISGTNILSIGRGVSVGGGGGEAIKPTFLLRLDFNQDMPAPLPSPYTEDGGSVVITDTESKLSIAGGAMVVAGGKAIPEHSDPGVLGEPLDRVAGRTLLVKSDQTNTAFSVGFDNAPGGTLQGSTSIYFGGDSIRSYYSNVIGDIALGSTYFSAIALRSLGSFAIVKGGSYPDWTLLWVYDSGSNSALYPGFANYSASIKIDTIRVTDLAGPWSDDFGIATDRIAGGVSAGATFSHEADCLVEWKQTTLPSSDYSDVWLRRIDADNGIVVSTASDGAIELYAVESGNWTLLGFTAPGTAANGHRFVVVCDGADIRVYSNNTLQITGSSSVGQSATSGRLDALGTGGAVSNVVSWPRVISGIAKQWLDAAIAD